MLEFKIENANLKIKDNIATKRIEMPYFFILCLLIKIDCFNTTNPKKQLVKKTYRNSTPGFRFNSKKPNTMAKVAIIKLAIPTINAELE